MIAAALLLASFAAIQADAPVVIRVTGSTDACRATVGSHSFDPRIDSADRDAALATVPDGVSVRIVAEDDAPYRCIGGVVYDLQRRWRGQIDVVLGTPTAP